MVLKLLATVILIPNVLLYQNLSGQPIDEENFTEVKVTSNSDPVTEDIVINVGVGAGYTRDVHVADFRALPGVPSCCPNFKSGFGHTLDFGLLFAFPVDREELFFPFLKAGYYSTSAHLSRIESVLLEIDGAPAPGEFEHAVDADFSGLDFLIGVKSGFGFITNFTGANFSVGFGAEVPLKADYSQIETIVDPSDRGYFTDTETDTRNDNSGDLEDVAPARYYLDFGLSYQLNPSQKHRLLQVAPRIDFKLPLNNYVTDVDWKAYSLRLGVDVFASLRRKPEPVKETPEIEPLPPKREFEKTASDGSIDYGDFDLSVKGLEGEVEVDSVLIRGEEYLSTTLKPLLNYVFFDEKSSEIPAKYSSMLPSETEGFEIEELNDYGIIETYRELLNIVGKRMTERPASKITLIGCNDGVREMGDLDLSENRAESVMSYLTSVWNIDPSRIEIDKRNLPASPSNVNKQDGIEENRRVEIHSEDWEIIKPIIIKDTTRIFNPPAIRIKVNSDADVDDLSWKINIFQEDHKLKTIEGEGNPSGDYDRILDELFKTVDPTVEPIGINMTVRSRESDEELEFSKTIPTEMITLSRKREQSQTNYRLDKYGLILFPFDKSELTGANKKIVEIINGRIEPESEVTVNAHTDRTGKADYNLKLSRRRAESAAGYLKKEALSVEGFGEKNLLHDNETPEGRFYCRTVIVNVKTPVK